MAKIDTSAIEGYADMSAEDKLAALESFEYDDHAEELAKANDEAKRYKDAVSKANSEAAEFKRQLKDAQATGAQTQTEAEKQIEQMAAQLKQLQRDKTIADYSSRLIGQGYDAELAASSATALADGDMETLFGNAAKFLEDHDTKLRAGFAQKSIEPPAGNKTPDGGMGMTRKKLLAMTPYARATYAAAHPEEYKKLMK